MMNEPLAKEIEALVEKDLNKPRLATARSTVTSDIEALKAKLDMLAKGINLLRDQL